MDWVKIVTDYYKEGYYDSAAVKVFVVKSKITAADFQAITGELYTV